MGSLPERAGQRVALNLEAIWSPTGKLIVSSCYDRNLYFEDLSRPSPQATLVANEAVILGLFFKRQVLVLTLAGPCNNVRA
jgi:hypothetical protein